MREQAGDRVSPSRPASGPQSGIAISVNRWNTLKPIVIPTIGTNDRFTVIAGLAHGPPPAVIPRGGGKSGNDDARPPWVIVSDGWQYVESLMGRTMYVWTAIYDRYVTQRRAHTPRLLR